MWHFVGIRPAQIQQCRLSRTAHRQCHLQLHRHIHHCPYKQIICLFRVVCYTTLSPSDTVQRRIWLLDVQVDTDCQTLGFLSGFLRLQDFLFVVPRRLIGNQPYRCFGKARFFSIFKVNQAEMLWFAVYRGCSSTTPRNSVNDPKFPDDSDVHSWLTEDIDLKFHEETEVNFTAYLVRAVLSTTVNKPRQKTARYFLFCNAKLKSVPIELIRLTFSRFLYVCYSESKYLLRMPLVHPRDCHFAHVQWLPLSIEKPQTPFREIRVVFMFVPVR